LTDESRARAERVSSDDTATVYCSVRSAAQLVLER
jgi:hypothetical protein